MKVCVDFPSVKLHCGGRLYENAKLANCAAQPARIDSAACAKHSGRLPGVQNCHTQKVKSRQHPDFPSGHPPEYYPGLRLLNFTERTGYGVLSLRWPSTLGLVRAHNCFLTPPTQIYEFQYGVSLEADTHGILCSLFDFFGPAARQGDPTLYRNGSALRGTRPKKVKK